MKKIIINVLLGLLFIFPVSVLAEGYISVSPTSLTLEQGSSTTFSITAYNTIGDVYIVSNDSSVASVSASEWGTGMVDEKQTKTGYITVSGNNIGTTTITLSIDAATFDGEDLAGQIKTITVNVVAKSVPEPTPTPSNNNNNNNNNNGNNSNTNNINNSEKSTNNKLKSLSVSGYEINKIDDNNYSLIVANNVTSIDIKGVAEDKKSKIDGIGTKELNVGENNYEIVITTESGDQNKINLSVTRKDGYYLEDLDEIINDKTINNIQIIIDKDSKITKNQIEKIKKNKKSVNLNYYDENKKLLYSWIIDGKKIDNSGNLITFVTFNSKNESDILKLSNYVDGKIFSFDSSNNIKLRIKVYVGDKYKDNNKLNIYYYNKNLKLIESQVKVKDGYIEFEVDNGGDYLVTMATIQNLKSTSKSTNIFLIISIIEFAIIVCILCYYFIKIRSKKLKKINKQEELIQNGK